MIALQTYESSVEPGRADPDVADLYLSELLVQCRSGAAQILVAELDARVIGWIGVVPQYTSEDVLERYRDFAYITDLIVLEAYRGKGVGRQLLATAEKYCESKGAKRIRVGVLARNGHAHRVYAAAGFRDYEVILEKEIGKHGG